MAKINVISYDDYVKTNSSNTSPIQTTSQYEEQKAKQNYDSATKLYKNVLNQKRQIVKEEANKLGENAPQRLTFSTNPTPTFVRNANGTTTIKSPYEQNQEAIKTNQEKKQLLTNALNNNATYQALNELETPLNNQRLLAKYNYDVVKENNHEITFLDRTLGVPLRAAQDFFNVGSYNMNDFYIDENNNKMLLPQDYQIRQENVRNSYGDDFLGKAARFGTDLGYNLTKIGLSSALNSLTGGGGIPVGSVMYFEDMGLDSYNQAKLDGYDDKSAALYSVINVASEMITEKFLGGISKKLKLTKGDSQLATGINKALSKVMKNDRLRSVLSNALSEGAEEFVQEFVENYNKKLVLEKKSLGQATKETILNSEVWGDALYSTLLGMGSGGLLGTVGNTSIDTNNTGVIPDMDKQGNIDIKTYIDQLNIAKRNASNQTQLDNINQTLSYLKLNEALGNDTVNMQTMSQNIKNLKPTLEQVSNLMPDDLDVIQYQNFGNRLNNEPETYVLPGNGNEVYLPKASDNVNIDNNIATQQATQQATQNIEDIGTEQRLQFAPTSNEKINNLYDTASRYFNNSEQTLNLMNTLSKVVKDKGYNIVFDNTNMNGINGKVETKNGEVTITLNPTSPRAFEFVAVHEITHAIETSSLKNMIMSYAKKNGEFNAALDSLKKTYGTNDVTSEVIADISGQLLGNQEFINNLSMEQPGLFRRIYNEIKAFYHKLRGWKSQDEFVQDLMNKWEYAYATQQNNLKNQSYSIDEDIDANIKGEYKHFDNYYDYAKELTNNKNDLAKELLFKNYNYRFEVPTTENETSFYHGTDAIYDYDALKTMDYNESSMVRNYGDYFYITPDKSSAETYGKQIAQFIIPNDKIMSLDNYRQALKNGQTDSDIFNKYWAIEMPDNEYIVNDIKPVIEYSKNKAQDYINSQGNKNKVAQNEKVRYNTIQEAIDADPRKESLAKYNTSIDFFNLDYDVMRKAIKIGSQYALEAQNIGLDNYSFNDDNYIYYFNILDKTNNAFGITDMDTITNISKEVVNETNPNRNSKYSVENSEYEGININSNNQSVENTTTSTDNANILTRKQNNENRQTTKEKSANIKGELDNSSFSLEQNYRGSHQIENAKSITELNINEIENKVTEANGYLTRQDNTDLSKLKKILKNPNEMVKIYRASPVNELNSGDWVTTDRAYAKNVADNNGGKVYTYEVQADQLYYPDNVNDLPSLHRLSSFQYVENSKTSSIREVKYSKNATEWNNYLNKTFSKDNNGRNLSKQQREYFKDSKVVDNNGNLITVYHTTTDEVAQFNEFNPVGTKYYRFGEQVVNYYTNSKNMSGSYSSQDYQIADTTKINNMSELNNYLHNEAVRTNNVFNIEKSADGKYILSQESELGKEAKNFINNLSENEMQQMRDNIYYDESMAGTPYEKAFSWDKFDKELQTKYNNVLDKYMGSADLVAMQQQMMKYIENPNLMIENTSSVATEIVKTYNSESEMFRNIKQDIQNSNWSKNSKIQYEGYLDIKNPYVIDAEERNWNQVVQQSNEFIDELEARVPDDVKNNLNRLYNESAEKSAEARESYDKYQKIINEIDNERLTPNIDDDIRKMNAVIKKVGIDEIKLLSEDVSPAGLSVNTWYNLSDTLKQEGVIGDATASFIIDEFKIPKTVQEWLNNNLNKNINYEGINNLKQLYEDNYEAYNTFDKYRMPQDYFIQEISAEDSDYLGNELEDILETRSEIMGADAVAEEIAQAASVSFSKPELIRLWGTSKTTNDIVKEVIASNTDGTTNYDGVIIKNVYDYGGRSNGETTPNDVYVTFNSNQFKAADNTNPTTDSDIRYSKNNKTWQQYLEENYISRGIRTFGKDILTKENAQNKATDHYIVKNVLNSNINTNIDTAVIKGNNVLKAKPVETKATNINTNVTYTASDINNMFQFEDNNNRLIALPDEVGERLATKTNMTPIEVGNLQNILYSATNTTENGNQLEITSDYENNIYTIKATKIGDAYVIDDVVKGTKNALSSVANIETTTNDEVESIDNKKSKIENGQAIGEVINKIKTESLKQADQRTQYKETVKKGTHLKESSFYKNATETSKFMTEDNRAKLSEVGDLKYYESVSNEESLNKASKRLKDYGTNEAIRWMQQDNKTSSATDVAEGWILLKNYQDAGDYDSMVAVAKKMRQMGTVAGQTVQAYNIMARLTPEGMVKYAQSELSEAYDIYAKNKSKTWIDQNASKFDLTAQEVGFIVDTMKQVQTMEDGRAKNVKLGEINKMLTDKLPAEKGSGIKAWMRISMLFNPKTQVRNVMGNAIITPINMVGDFFAAAADRYIAKKTGTRTTGTIDIKNYLKGFKKGLYESYDDFKLGINTRNVDANRFELGQAKSFNDNTKLGKALNKIDTMNSFLLDAGDRGFYEGSFTNSINNQLALNNTTKVTQDMIDIATSEALQRTWQDNNNYTKFVLTTRNMLNKVNVKGYGLGDILIPFAKTPANLTKAIIDYSPAGMINVIIQAKNLRNNISTGTNTAIQQHQFVQTLGKATAGTMLYIAAYALAKAGIATGQSDDDRDTRDFIKNTLGVSSYSIKIGNKSFTYDWAQPVAAPLSIMTNIVNSKDNKGQALLEAITSSLDSAGSILLEQSFVKSINEVLTDNDGIVSGLENAILDLPTRAIPTFMKQITDMIDGTQRQTFEYNQPLKTAINKVKAKIPGLSQTLASSVDSMGREIQKYGGKNNIFNVFLNPANVNTSNISIGAAEIYRVYKEVGDKTIMPRVAPYYINSKGQKTILNTDQRKDYQLVSGQIIEEGMRELLNNRNYREMSEEEKSAVIKNIIDYSYNKAKEEVLGLPISGYNSLEKWLQNGGTVANYYANKEEANFSVDSPTKYATLQNMGVKYYDYKDYQEDVNEIKEKYSGTNNAALRKQKVFEYINSLKLSANQKVLLFKMLGNYSIKDFSNQAYQYINSFNISAKEKQEIWNTLF